MLTEKNGRISRFKGRKALPGRYYSRARNRFRTILASRTRHLVSNNTYMGILRLEVLSKFGCMAPTHGFVHFDPEVRSTPKFDYRQPDPAIASEEGNSDGMFRTLARIMTEAFSSPSPKRVPIPKNGVDYRGKVVLAPMVRSGELPSRLLALRYGADLVWGMNSLALTMGNPFGSKNNTGPETVDRAMIGTTRRVNPRTSTIEFTRMSSDGMKNPELNPEKRESVIYRIHPELEKGKLIYQIGTSNPEYAVQAAKLVAADVAGIDVNAGCPKPFSTLGGMGAALLRTPDKLCAILEALVKEIGQVWEIGISVKIRLLETPAQTEALVRRLCATGITGLTVHCRTTPMRPRERAIRDQLRMIVRVCHEAGVACIMNGDVENREQALQLMQEYDADGAMIATAAEKNPSVFRTTEDGGRLHWKEVTMEYLKTAVGVENRWGNTKFLLAQHINGKDPMYQKMNQSKCYKECVEAIGLEEISEEAARLDDTLGISNKQPRAEKRKKAKEYAKQVGADGQKKTKQEDASSATIDVLHEPPGGLPAALAV